MTAELVHIFRHPVKALGREDLESVPLSPGEWIPVDRLWAVAHHRSKLGGGWAHCANFLRAATDPSVMAVTAAFDAASGRVVLRHPAAGEITADPDDAADQARLIDWVSAVWPADLPAPSRVYRAAGAHLTDAPRPWLSVHGMASHRAVEQRVGRTLSFHRWRGNLWIEGLAPWEEFGWIGREIRIGEAVLRVEDRIGRCKATMANPETGRRDTDTLGALRTWGHQDFGVFAEVVTGGTVSRGDPVVVPA